MSGRKDAIAGVLLAVIAGGVYYSTLGLPEGPSGGGLAPGSFPRALAIFIGVLSVLLAIRGLTAKPSDEIAEPLFGPGFFRMLGFLAAMAIYIFLMPVIGYIAPTVLFLFASFLIVAQRRTPVMIAAGLAFSIFAGLAVYYLFGIFLSVPLIEGPLDEFMRYSVFRIGG